MAAFSTKLKSPPRIMGYGVCITACSSVIAGWNVERVGDEGKCTLTTCILSPRIEISVDNIYPSASKIGFKILNSWLLHSMATPDAG